MTNERTKITVETIVNASIEKVWEYWNEPEHITKWAFASDDWCAPRAENDVRTGGTFLTRMESKDGKEGFDFGGTYTNVIPNEKIEYSMGEGGRKVYVDFIPVVGSVKILETFEAENENSLEMQKSGWQAILENFKKYIEGDFIENKIVT